jgi:hypothetical protein
MLDEEVDIIICCNEADEHKTFPQLGLVQCAVIVLVFAFESVSQS